MTKYIIKLSDNAFVNITNNTINVKQDFKKATMYPTIGEAFKAAAYVNSLLNTAAEVKPYYINK